MSKWRAAEVKKEKIVVAATLYNVMASFIPRSRPDPDIEQRQRPPKPRANAFANKLTRDLDVI